MEFYDAIAYRYDHIFPFSPKQKEFILNSLSSPADADVLEIGCATGSLTLELAKDCHEVTGIDLDGLMVDYAKKKASQEGIDLQLLQMNMLDIADAFSPTSFDSICCFGNTLVHLDTRQQMADLFSSVRTILKPDAPFHIQIINYDRVLDEAVTSLPTIENDIITFERNYSYVEEEHKIAFSTILTDKVSGRTSSQMVKLYPLRRIELEGMLIDAGFSNIEVFGSFAGNPYTQDSIPLILSAT